MEEAGSECLDSEIGSSLIPFSELPPGYSSHRVPNSSFWGPEHSLELLDHCTVVVVGLPMVGAVQVAAQVGLALVDLTGAAWVARVVGTEGEFAEFPLFGVAGQVGSLGEPHEELCETPGLQETDPLVGSHIGPDLLPVGHYSAPPFDWVGGCA